MDVSKDVELGFLGLKLCQQVFAAYPIAMDDTVQDTEGWAVSDEDVGVWGDEVPVLGDLWSPLTVKGPVVEPRLDGGAPNLDAFDLCPAVVQVGDIGGNHGEELVGFVFGEKVVVASYKDFMRMRACAKPIHEGLDLMGAATTAYIACVNQEVAFWDGHLVVLAVGIRNQY